MPRARFRGDPRVAPTLSLRRCCRAANSPDLSYGSNVLRHIKTMSILKSALPALLLATQPVSAQTVQQSCRDNPNALSTSRVITVDAATTPRVGRKHFPTTLPLADKVVVLTFDDGPWPGTTSAVLNALRRECVLATFFP